MRLHANELYTRELFELSMHCTILLNGKPRESVLCADEERGYIDYWPSPVVILGGRFSPHRIFGEVKIVDRRDLAAIYLK